jgi:transposase
MEAAMAAKDVTPAEVWKDIPEYRGYQASNLGRIGSFWKQANRKVGSGYESFVSKELRVLKPRPTGKGYLKINLRHDSGKIRTRMVHQLVLAAFIGPRPPGMVTCHKHGSRTNNAVGNLRWSTQRSNLQDAGHKGTKKVLSREQIDEMLQLARNGMLGSELAVRFGVGRPSISRALAREGFQYKRSYRRPSVLSADALASGIELARAGTSHKEIARRLGVSRPTITRWLARSSGKLAIKDC